MKLCVVIFLLQFLWLIDCFPNLDKIMVSKVNNHSNYSCLIRTNINSKGALLQVKCTNCEVVKVASGFRVNTRNLQLLQLQIVYEGTITKVPLQQNCNRGETKHNVNDFQITNHANSIVIKLKDEAGLVAVYTDGKSSFSAIQSKPVREYEIKGLHKDTLYEICISVLNTAGESGKYSCVKTKTKDLTENKAQHIESGDGCKSSNVLQSIQAEITAQNLVKIKWKMDPRGDCEIKDLEIRMFEKHSEKCLLLLVLNTEMTDHKVVTMDNCRDSKHILIKSLASGEVLEYWRHSSVHVQGNIVTSHGKSFISGRDNSRSNFIGSLTDVNRFKQPGRATNITVNSVSVSSLRISWKAPEVTFNNTKAQKYMVMLNAEKIELNTQKETITLLCQDLDECTEYCATVTAINEGGSSPPSDVFCERTLAKGGGKVVLSKIKYGIAQSRSISWSYSSEKCVKKYKIVYWVKNNKEECRQELYSNKKSFNLDQLPSNMQYELQVEALLYKTESGNANISSNIQSFSTDDNKDMKGIGKFDNEFRKTNPNFMFNYYVDPKLNYITSEYDIIFREPSTGECHRRYRITNKCTFKPKCIKRNMDVSNKVNDKVTNIKNCKIINETMCIEESIQFSFMRGNMSTIHISVYGRKFNEWEVIRKNVEEKMSGENNRSYSIIGYVFGALAIVTIIICVTVLVIKYKRRKARRDRKMQNVPFDVIGDK